MKPAERLARLVKCPLCGAEPDDPCRSTMSGKPTTYHVGRVEDALDRAQRQMDARRDNGDT